MMTASGWMSVSAAEKYHAEDNYYTKTLGIFRGNKRLLSKLGIKPGQHISKRKGKAIFNKLLRGINPATDKSMFRKLPEGKERRAGFDVTFSPSKSVSLVYEFGSEVTRKAIAAAHQKSVQMAMASVQKHIKVKVPSSKTKNGSKAAQSEIIYAEIEHDVSRESEKTGYIDPDLHTHNFIMNIGLDIEGGDKIRSLDINEIFHKNTGTNTHLINQIGAEYRLSLANELEKIGIKMDVTDKDQNFYEVAGVTRADVLHFSQRSREIKIQAEDFLKWKIKEVEKEGKAKGKTKEQIALDVQKIKNNFGYKDEKIASQNNKIAKKNNVNRDELREQNRGRFLDYKGQDSLLWAENIISKGKVLIEEKRVNLLKDITPALVILAEKEGVTLQEMTEKLAKDETLWNEEATEVSPLISNVREALEAKDVERASKIVELAIKSVEQQSSLFTSKVVLEQAMIMAVEDKLPPELLKAEIEKAVASGEMIPFALTNGNLLFSTPDIHYAEKEVFEFVEAGKDKMKPLLNEEQKAKMEAFRQSHPIYSGMNKGQVEMVDFIFSNTDQFLAGQGDAGTGKTFSLAFLNEAIEQIDPNLAKKLVGISFTGQAAAGIETSSKIDSTTLDTFIMQNSNPNKKQEGGRFIIVDEATMVGSIKMKKLYEIAKRNGDRVLLMGDPKQFAAISAGSLFKDLLDAKIINKFELTEIMRQKNVALKRIVQDMKVHKYTKALDSLAKRGSLFEMDNEQAVLASTSKYIDAIQNAKMGDDIVDRSMIISSTNIVREATNEFVRDELKDRGLIAKEGHNVDTYSSISMVGIQQYMASKIAANKPDFVAVNGGVRGLNNGESYLFAGVSEDKRSILVLDKDGNKVPIDMEEYGESCQFFQQTKKEFVKGEVIVLTKNMKKIGYLNGMRGKILDITENTMTVDIEGKIKVINTDEYPYIDHGYAVTDYKSQGATTGHVIAIAHPRMATTNSIYTQMTRCVHEATMITSNMKELYQNANKSGVAESTIGKARLPKDVALQNIWSKKVPLKEDSVEKVENPLIRETLENAANEAITIPDFVKKCEDKGIYVNLHNKVAVLGKERIKLDDIEIAVWKKGFRKNYSIAKKAGLIPKSSTAKPSKNTNKIKGKSNEKTRSRQPKRGSRVQDAEPNRTRGQNNSDASRGQGQDLDKSIAKDSRQGIEERSRDEKRSVQELSSGNVASTAKKTAERGASGVVQSNKSTHVERGGDSGRELRRGNTDASSSGKKTARDGTRSDVAAEIRDEAYKKRLANKDKGIKSTMNEQENQKQNDQGRKL